MNLCMLALKMLKKYIKGEMIIMKKNYGKFLLAIFMTVLFLGMPISNVANAAESTTPVVNSEANCSIEELIANDSSKTTSIDENGIETTEITNPETLKSIEQKLDKPNPEDELKSFIVQKDTNIQDKINDENIIKPKFITSIQKTSTRAGCGSSRIGYVSGTGVLELTVSKSIMTETSANISVGIDKIGAELGQKIQSSVTVSAKTTHNAGNKIGEIVAYSSLTIINFDVYRFGLKAESGSVYIADGVCFAKY